MWLTKLKTALALEEIEVISSLVDEMPVFETLDEMEQAAYLLNHAKTLIEEKKFQTAHSLQQLKNNLNFLKSSHTNQPSSLNLKF